MAQKERDLTTGSIPGHLKHLAIPASVGMFFNTMFNVVDTFYAGRLNTEALAGMSLSFSIFFLIIAISSGLGTGTNALASRHLGKKDRSGFGVVVTNAFFLGLVSAVLLTLLGYLISPFLFDVLGATGKARAYGLSYVNTLYLGSLFFILNALLNAVLSSQGNTKPYRNFLVAGFFLNLILDPLFIYGWWGLPRLETAGVALATLIIQMMGTLYLTREVIVREWFAPAEIQLKSLSFSKQLELLEQGIPAGLNMMTVALGVYMINYFILRHAGDQAVAAYGVAVRVEQLALLPALGLNVATLSIAGQNAGAGHLDRLYTLYKKSLRYGLTIMTLAMVVVYPLAPHLIRLFNSDPGVIEKGTAYLRIEFLAFNTYILLNISISLLQGMKKPWWAIGIGLYRQFIGAAALFYLLGTLLGLGLTGIWWGIVLANWSAALITVAYTLYRLRHFDEKDDEN